MEEKINKCRKCGQTGIYAAAGGMGGVVCLKCGNTGPGFKAPSNLGRLKSIFFWNKENQNPNS